MESTHQGLDALFNPASVAVVGATNDVTRIGGVPLDLMIRRGYGVYMGSTPSKDGALDVLPLKTFLARLNDGDVLA